MRSFILFASVFVLSACPRPSEGPQLSTTVIGHCAYTGPNSRLSECKDYLGAWKTADAEKDCTKDLRGTYEGGTICSPVESETLGVCLFGNKPEQNRTWIVSTNTNKCNGGRTGCEVFGGGYWNPSTLCGGANTEIVVLEGMWKRPTRVCTDDGDGGQRCVWNSIHGATVEGRSFRDDAKCDDSRSGRPYYPKDPDDRYAMTDDRRTDSTYLAEEAWVRSQINATSCVCCHSSAAPNGEASIFDIDREGSIANQLTDRGIGHGSSLVNSIPLGAFPADINNGFIKSDWAHPDYSVFLSTDPARMKTFWMKEAEHRGLTAESFVGVPDGFGPLSEQLYFKPEACTAGEGISADGLITWGNGRARYVYVMEANAKSPTVFPNLDLPADTLWKLDVPYDAAPLSSGTVRYGQVPEGMTQAFPMAGAPATLTSGKQYYLYVAADQMLYVTRCLVTAP